MLAFSVPPGYRRSRPPARPKLDPFTGIIDRILAADEGRPRKQRHTSKRMVGFSQSVARYDRRGRLGHLQGRTPRLRSDSGQLLRRRGHDLPRIEFAADSPLEETGFERSVPRKDGLRRVMGWTPPDGICVPT